MCGIAGRVNQSAPVDRAEIFRMTELIAHRGPDDHGYHLRTRVGLGHRRLSHHRPRRRPPAARQRGRHRLDRLQRRDLQPRRAAPASWSRAATASAPTPTPRRSSTPTKSGAPTAPSRLRGMFAFAIWDERAAAPDARARSPGHQAALLRAARRRSRLRLRGEVAPRRARASTARVDDDALAAYLALRYVPAPLTMFRGVKKLPPATILTWQAGRVSISRYWDLADVATRDDAPPTEAEATAELRERIDHVTQAAPDVRGAGRRLPLRRPRLDHHHRVDAARRRRARRAQDLHVGYAERRHAVRGRARLRAPGRRRRSAPSTTRCASPCARPPTRCPRSSGTSTSRSPIPPACRSTSSRSRAKEQVTVVLSGEGADEALGGYYIYRRMARSRRCASGSAGRRRRALARRRAARRSCRTTSVRRAARLFGAPARGVVPRRVARLRRRRRGAAAQFHERPRTARRRRRASRCSRRTGRRRAA